MNITPHEWQNAQQALQERRRQVVSKGSASSKGQPPVTIEKFNPVTRAFFQQAGQPALAPHPAQGSGELTAEELAQARQFFGLVTLDSLTTDHMAAAAAARYRELLAAVREWRRENVPGQAFVVCSKSKGAGKTHIGKAVMDSFSRIYWTGERPRFYGAEVEGITLERNGALITARQCMELVGEGEGWQEKLAARRWQIVVLDDVGREGLLKFIKQDETQVSERQARYYEFINFCYEVGLKLFMTSNLLWGEMERFFNSATWSRLNEMAPAGNVYELLQVPDYRLLMSGRQTAKVAR